jgi:hypothetical protein
MMLNVDMLSVEMPLGNGGQGGSDKHFNLLRYENNYACEKFYDRGLIFYTVLLPSFSKFQNGKIK